MGSMTVRNLPKEIHDGLRLRARKNGRSIEAEVRSILAHTVTAVKLGGFGQRLRNRFGDTLGDDLDITRDPATSDPNIFQ